MCDFHSILGIAIGDKYEIRHDPSNSHSGMAGSLENKPNRQCVIYEAECSADTLKRTKDIDAIKPKIIRNFGECPEPLVRKIVTHYQRVRESLLTGNGLDSHFSDMSKWSDVWANATTLPADVKFPDSCGHLDLRSDIKAELAKRKKSKSAKS